MLQSKNKIIFKFEKMEELALRKIDQFEKMSIGDESLALERKILEGVGEDSVLKDKLIGFFSASTRAALAMLDKESNTISKLVDDENNNDEENLAEQNGEKKTIEQEFAEERFRMDEFIKEIQQIDSQLSEVEMEAAIMKAVSRLDLFLSTNNNLVKEKSGVSGQRAKDFLVRYQEKLEKELSGEQNVNKLKILKELLGDQLFIEE